MNGMINLADIARQVVSLLSDIRSGLPVRIDGEVSRNASAGREVTLTPQALISTMQPLIEFHGPTAGARPIALTFDIRADPPDQGAQVVAFARALIEYGSGGHKGQIEIDVGRGTVAVVPGSWVRVRATIPSLVDEPLLQQVVVGVHAAVSEGRPTVEPTIRGVRYGLIAPAGSEVLAIPQKATRVSLQRTDTDMTTAHLDFLDATGAVISDFYMASGAGGYFGQDPVIIPARAFQVRVRNPGFVAFSGEAVFLVCA